jgi:hypothetical protein
MEERAIIEDQKKMKTWNEGRPRGNPEKLPNELLPYVDELRESGNALRMTIVTIELL